MLHRFCPNAIMMMSQYCFGEKRNIVYCVLRYQCQRGEMYLAYYSIFFISGLELTPRVEVVSPEGKTQVRDKKDVMFLLFV